MRKVKDESYFQISGWMINRLGLKGTTLNVYAIIFGFTQDGESEFTGSRQYLCEFTGATKPTIDKSLNELIDKHLIIKKSNVINNVLFNKYKVNLDMINNFTSSKETLLGGSKETLHNNNIVNDNIDYKYIVDYLNFKAKTNYKHTSNKTKSFIRARINDGFNLDDFKKVIDNKCLTWLNTEFEQYLRPETLFGTKFESYLNTKQVKLNETYQKREYKEKDLNSLYDDIDNVEI